MAKVTAGAAYKQLTKVGDYISPNINAGADRIARQGMRQKQLNADAKARADKRLDEALGGIQVDTEALQSKATGFETRDDVARDYAYTATQRSMEYAELAREAAQNGDWVAMNNYKGKMKRIEGDFKNTVNDEKLLGEIFTGYRDKYQSGEIDDDEWLDFAESMEKFNYEIKLDENDNKVITAIELDDEGQPVMDAEGNPKVMTKKWADVVNQRDRPFEVVRLEDKEGKKGLIGDMLSTMGKRKYDEETGQYITTTQTWDDEAERQFTAKVKGLQSNDRTMYSLLKQASGGEITKKKDFTDSDKQLVEDFLRFQVKGGYDTEESMKVRTMTVEEREAEAAKNRAVTMRGQDIGKEKADASNQIALKKLALEEWKAQNPNKTLSKGDEKKAQNEALVVKFYEVAKAIGNLGDKADDAQVQKVLDDSGLGFIADTDWQLWFQDNEFDIGTVKDIKNKDAFKIVKGMAKKAGLEMKDTDVREAINAIQAGKAEEKPAGTKATEGMTAQEKIDYYKNLNKK